jgi:hypothetical protein
MRREMVESGVVGAEAFSGKSSGVSVGKSFSTMHENFTSTSTTESSGWSIGFLSGESTESTLSGSRDLARTVDVTNRNAAEERRDLLSHMTSVNNILTLLTTHHIGSPYLRFSLWPTPLRPLTIDPADPNIWYRELLHRRSSGIEGLQDFYAVAVVPNDRRICIEARLRRVCVVQPLPPRLFLPVPLLEPLERSVLEDRRVRMLEYLNRRYPAGTLLEDELDTEIDTGELKRAVALLWNVGSLDWLLASWPQPVFVIARGLLLVDSNWITVPRWFEYKTPDEVWLETQRAEFERKLLESPLESGAVVSSTLTLIRCWGDSPLEVIDTVTRDPGRLEDWRWRSEGPSWSLPGESPSARSAAYRRAVFTWNALEDELTQYVLSSNKTSSTPFSPDHPTITKLILESMSRLNSDHRVNHPIELAEKLFGFSKTRIAQLRKKGIVDFRGLAQTLLDLPAVERYNKQAEISRAQLEKLPQTERPQLLPELLPLTLSRQEADRIFGDLNKGLAGHSSVKPDEGGQPNATN